MYVFVRVCVSNTYTLFVSSYWGCAMHSASEYVGCFGGGVLFISNAPGVPLQQPAPTQPKAFLRIGL